MSQLIKIGQKEKFKDILALVSLKYHVVPTQLYSKTKDQRIVHARFMVWYLLSWQVGWTTGTIGEFFKKDRATVLSGLKKAEALGLDKEARKLWRIRTQKPLST